MKLARDRLSHVSLDSCSTSQQSLVSSNLNNLSFQNIFYMRSVISNANMRFHMNLWTNLFQILISSISTDCHSLVGFIRFRKTLCSYNSLPSLTASIFIIYSVAGLTMYIRYRQLEQALHKLLPFSPTMYRINYASFILGMLASFGVSMVGNFQVSSIIKLTREISQ